MNEVLRFAALVFVTAFAFAATPRDDAQAVLETCGAPCAPEGASSACIDPGGRPVFTSCTCGGGVWVCGAGGGP
jgi:hypothetical protein